MRRLCRFGAAGVYSEKSGPGGYAASRLRFRQDATVQLLELAVSPRGRAHRTSGSPELATFGNDHIANAWAVEHQHHQAVKAEGKATMLGRR